MTVYFKRLNVFLEYEAGKYQSRTKILVRHGNRVIKRYFNTEKYKSGGEFSSIIEYLNIIFVLRKLLDAKIQAGEIYFYLNSRIVANQLNGNISADNAHIRHLSSVVLFFEKQLNTHLFFKLRSDMENQRKASVFGASLFITTLLLASASYAYKTPDTPYSSVIGRKDVVFSMPMNNPYQAVTPGNTALIPVVNGVWVIQDKRKRSKEGQNQCRDTDMRG